MTCTCASVLTAWQCLAPPAFLVPYVWCAFFLQRLFLHTWLQWDEAGCGKTRYLVQTSFTSGVLGVKCRPGASHIRQELLVEYTPR